MQFTSERIRYAMKEEDIVCIESRRNGSVIYGKQRLYPNRNSMAYWAATLSSGRFFRCHEGYIVNLYRITEVRNEELLLDDGRRVPISRRRRTALLNLLTRVEKEA